MARLLTKKAAADQIGVHREHLMRMSRQGRFPRPVKLGDAVNCAVRFDAADVEAWIAERKEAAAA
jgi:predicted DNA-binding transcriptional regulator AlpA